MVVLSFLLPTRDRLSLLKDSINSVFEMAGYRSNVEVLLAVDDDDPSLEVTRDFVASHPCSDSIFIHTYPRHGYKGLHHYINDLCKHARGDHFVLWNDDARVVTPCYEEVVRHAASDASVPQLYQFRTNHGDDIFPMVPACWFKTLGHFSLNAHNDSWVLELANTLGVNAPLDIFAWHMRGDNLHHPMYAEVDKDIRISNPLYHSPENVAARAADIETLRRAFYSSA